MVNGYKKLSEFTGQEHITSVLRASIIKKQPITELGITGDREIVYAIANAYQTALNCLEPVRGDACGECKNCLWWPAQNITNLTYANHYVEDAVNFQVKSPVGVYINPEILNLLIYSYQSSKADVMTASRKIAKELTFDEFTSQYLNVMTNILYLKNNLEVKEIDKLEALRALANRISVFDVTACIRLLWDSQSVGTLPDATSIEIVSLLLSEALQPTPKADRNEIWTQTDEKPIKVIEEDNLEQPLELHEMLAIARA